MNDRLKCCQSHTFMIVVWRHGLIEKEHTYYIVYCYYIQID
jgi:hypothetical protein